MVTRIVAHLNEPGLERSPSMKRRLQKLVRPQRGCGLTNLSKPLLQLKIRSVDSLPFQSLSVWRLDSERSLVLLPFSQVSMCG